MSTFKGSTVVRMFSIDHKVDLVLNHFPLLPCAEVEVLDMVTTIPAGVWAMETGEIPGTLTVSPTPSPREILTTAASRSLLPPGGTPPHMTTTMEVMCGWGLETQPANLLYCAIECWSFYCTVLLSADPFIIQCYRVLILSLYSAIECWSFHCTVL